MTWNDAAMESLLDDLCSGEQSVEEFLTLIEGTYQ